MSALDRLTAKVEIDPMSQCWVWTGARSGRGWDQGGGYSAFYFQGRLTSGHRASYEMHRGPIPDGLTIDHLCRNTLCVNPDHLEAVTAEVNTRRAAAAIEACPKGHVYDEANTYIDTRGTRQCRKCRSAAVQRCKAKRRAA